MSASREPTGSVPRIRLKFKRSVVAVQSTPYCGGGERGEQRNANPPPPSDNTFLRSLQRNCRYFPPFPSSASALSRFLSLFLFFQPSLPPSLPLSAFPAQRPLPGYACSARFGCVLVTRFSQVPGLTLYVSLRSRSLLPLLSPSSASPGRPALLQMHRCSSLQGPAKKNGLPAAAGS